MLEFGELLLVDKGCPKLNLQIRANNKEAINFYKAVGYDGDEVISFGKRLIEDWNVYLQSTYIVKIKHNKNNALYDTHYWVGTVHLLNVTIIYNILSCITTCTCYYN